MELIERENQYAIVARNAYKLIIEQKLSFEKAWQLAAKEHIKSEESRKKQCPWHTFLGFCESGDLRGISPSDKSSNINNKYAKFAVGLWQKNKNLSNAETWKLVHAYFRKAQHHNGQLDVARDLTGYLK